MLTKDLFAALQALEPKAGQKAVPSYFLDGGNSLAGTWWFAPPYTTPGDSEPPPQSPLEKALTGILTPAPGAPCFIDVLDLNNGQESSFFSDAPTGHGSIYSLLNAAVDAQTTGSPVIRYLMGSWSTKTGAPPVIPPAKDSFIQGLGELTFTNTKADVYYCNFDPTVLAAEQGAAALGARDLVEDAEGSSAADGWIATIEAILKGMWADLLDGLRALEADVSQVIAVLERISPAELLGWLKAHVQMCTEICGTWNHAKMLSINGQRIVIGGFNFWTAYESRQGWLYDLGCTVNGPAAASCQTVVDAMWGFANGLATTSQLYPQGAPLSATPLSFTAEQAPLFVDAGAAPGRDGSCDVLTVAELGLSKVPVIGVSYPSLLINAVRDFVVNFVAIVDVQQTLATGAATAYLVEDLLSDDDPGFRNKLSMIGSHPTNWASRYIRAYAVAGATSSVYLSQQKLMMDDLAREKPYQKAVVAPINARLAAIYADLDLSAPEPWDGIIRPFDLYAAIGKAMVGIDESAAATKPGVMVIGSTPSTAGGGYEDPVVLPSFERDLANVLSGLIINGDVKTTKGTSWLVDTYLSYRTVNSSGASHGNHAKMVIVDGGLAYIGSHNAYPSYNFECGVWVDDPTALADLIDGYWTPLWTVSTPVT